MARAWLPFVVLTGTAWGLTYALYPIGLQMAGPFWLSALRFDAFALGALAAALLVDGRVQRPVGARDLTAVAAYAGLNIVLHNLGTIGGSAHVPVAILAVLAGTTPILTAGLQATFLPQVRLSPRLVAGLAVGFVAVLLLAGSRGGVPGLAVSPWVVVVVLAFLAWAVGSVAVKATETRLPPLSLGFWAALASLPVLHGLALASPEPIPVPSLRLAAVVLFIGLVGGVGGFLLWLRVVRAHGPAHASLASFVSPAVASLAAVALLAQPIGWLHLVAYLLVAGGLALAWSDFAGTAARPAPPAAAAPK